MSTTGTSTPHTSPRPARTTHPAAAGNPVNPRLRDWYAWLNLTATPTTPWPSETQTLLWVHGGVIAQPHLWPPHETSRVYAAFDDLGAVYVGQTRRMLLTRIRSHFGNQRTPTQQQKAGTWTFIMTAAFPDLTANELDVLERSAAKWLLPLRHRAGRRHPRTPSQ